MPVVIPVPFSVPIEPAVSTCTLGSGRCYPYVSAVSDEASNTVEDDGFISVL